MWKVWSELQASSYSLAQAPLWQALGTEPAGGRARSHSHSVPPSRIHFVCLSLYQIHNILKYILRNIRNQLFVEYLCCNESYFVQADLNVIKRRE